MEKNKYYPKSYVMSDSLKAFFMAVSNDKNLQQQLFETQKIADVATIAHQNGYQIEAVEVLKAQAGRVLAIIDENSEDVQRLVTGLKPKTGAQWGRGGGGFLDRAGYWLLELPQPLSSAENAQQISNIIEEIRSASLNHQELSEAKTFSEVAHVFQTAGFELPAAVLLSYQAEKILALSSDQLEKLVAS